MNAHLRVAALKEQYATDLANHARINLPDFIRVLVPLLVIAATIQVLQIEQAMALPSLMWISVAGFALYAWLPVTLRLPFYLLLNLVALVFLFGPACAFATTAFGSLLVISATLPARGIYRVTLVLGLGIYLGLARAGLLGDVLLTQVSGIIGGLFMFRAILYLYEMQYETGAVSLWKRVAYFFMLPNLIFQLFPIVDYKTFVRGYYPRPAAVINRNGLHWIGVGVVHLLAYRVIYHYGLPRADEINNLLDLAQYLVFNYALILRLSGIFHICAGLLGLFGFDLPRTFDNYFLASSFSDLWRRINVYWRGFVMKLFYFPLYFRFKGLGRPGIFITVILVFGANFFLHAYQWFWIRGTIQVTQTDIIFWSVLGVLLACNSVMPAKSRAVARNQQYSHKAALLHAGKVLGIFCSMCMLWSLWTSGTVAQWLSLFTQISRPSMGQLVTLAAILAAVLGGGAFAQYLGANWYKDATHGLRTALQGPLASSIFFCFILLLATEPVTVYIQDELQVDLAPMRTNVLSAQDQELLSQGYYEDLVVTNNITSRVWEMRVQEAQANRLIEAKARVAGKTPEEVRRLQAEAGNKSSWVSLKEGGYLQYRDDAVRYRFVPNQTMVFGGVETNTNEYGMRDRSYTREKPERTYRIAQLAASPELGLGVGDDFTTDNVLEDRLSASSTWDSYRNVEILNFAAGGYSLMEQVAITDKLIGEFSPDALMLFIHDVNVFEKMRDRVAENMVAGRNGDYPYLLGLAEKLGINADTDPDTASRRLQPYEHELYFWGLDQISRYCQEHDIKLVVVYMGVMRERPRAARQNREILFPHLQAKDLLVFDLRDIFVGHDKAALIVAPWDLHPNQQGHALVADTIFTRMNEHRAYFINR